MAHVRLPQDIPSVLESFPCPLNLLSADFHKEKVTGLLLVQHVYLSFPLCLQIPQAMTIAEVWSHICDSQIDINV